MQTPKMTNWKALGVRNLKWYIILDWEDSGNELKLLRFKLLQQPNAKELRELKLAKAFACLQVDDGDPYGAVYLLEGVICGSPFTNNVGNSGDWHFGISSDDVPVIMLKNKDTDTDTDTGTGTGKGTDIDIDFANTNDHN
jgi:hypothetical protein